MGEVAAVHGEGDRSGNAPTSAAGTSFLSAYMGAVWKALLVAPWQVAGGLLALL